MRETKPREEAKWLHQTVELVCTELQFDIISYLGFVMFWFILSVLDDYWKSIHLNKGIYQNRIYENSLFGRDINEHFFRKTSKTASQLVAYFEVLKTYLHLRMWHCNCVLNPNSCFPLSYFKIIFWTSISQSHSPTLLHASAIGIARLNKTAPHRTL